MKIISCTSSFVQVRGCHACLSIDRFLIKYCIVSTVPSDLSMYCEIQKRKVYFLLSIFSPQLTKISNFFIPSISPVLSYLARTNFHSTVYHLKKWFTIIRWEYTRWNKQKKKPKCIKKNNRTTKLDCEILQAPFFNDFMIPSFSRHFYASIAAIIAGKTYSLVYSIIMLPRLVL